MAQDFGDDVGEMLFIRLLGRYCEKAAGIVLKASLTDAVQRYHQQKLELEGKSKEEAAAEAEVLAKRPQVCVPFGDATRASYFAKVCQDNGVGAFAFSDGKGNGYVSFAKDDVAKVQDCVPQFSKVMTSLKYREINDLLEKAEPVPQEMFDKLKQMDLPDIDKNLYEHDVTLFPVQVEVDGKNEIGYTMTGILMDAETGLPILTGDGSEKYTEADVAAFMQQLLDVLGLSAQDEDEGIADIVVSDETAEDGSVKKSQTVRVHADGTFEVIDTTYETDEDGLTSATVDASGKVGYDALTDEQKKAISDVAVLKDSGIVLNYSATGELPVSIDMDALGKFIADNEDLISHLVYQTAEFTPEKYDGTVTMDFHFNANDVIDRLGGETKDIVVFEVMSKNAVADEEGSAPVIVASECDLDSEEQTVNLVPTVIGTTATDKSDGDHTLMAGKDAVITDQHVTAELKFTPNSQNGTIDIDLGKFDASSLDGHDLVVFEELYKQTEQGNEATEVLVAEHKDIDDEGQTVTVTTTPPGGFFGKTGGNDFFIVVSIAALAVLACGCAYYGIKNRRAAKAEDAAADEGDDTDNGDVSGDSEA